MRPSAPFEAPFTVKARLVVCVREPDVPVKVTVAFAVCALPAALNVTCCEVPGVRFRLAEDTETPTGSPVI